MIYFLQAGANGPIKIGFSNNVFRRVKEIQSNNPVKLKLLGTKKGNKSKEAILHTYFQGTKIRGEWYKPSPLLIEYIKDDPNSN